MLIRNVSLTKREIRVKSLHLVLLAFTTLPPLSLSAQVTKERVREVLETSKAPSVLGNVGNEIVTGISQFGSQGDTAALAAAVRLHFSLDSLLNGMVKHLEERAEAEVFDELHAWLLSDSIRDIEAKADSASAGLPLREYAQRLQQSPPDQEVVQLVQRFAKAQHAGEFYVSYITSIHEAAVQIARAAGKDAPAVSQLTPAERRDAIEQFEQVAVVSFLQRFEPLSTEELRRFIDAYESRSGRWYVLAYTDAVAASIANAAQNVVAALAQSQD